MSPGRSLAGYAAVARTMPWWLLPMAALGNALGSYFIKLLLNQKESARPTP